jgi:uncharacterized OB-fold protein
VRLAGISSNPIDRLQPRSYKAPLLAMATAYTGPVPKPTPETRPFWDAAKQGKLLIQHCGDCNQHYFYPRPLCPQCLSRKVTWTESSGRGRLHTFVINHRPPRGFPPDTPIVIAIVELEEGPRLMTNLVAVEPDPTQLHCDMPVEVVFEALTDAITLPKFRPASAA